MILKETKPAKIKGSGLGIVDVRNRQRLCKLNLRLFRQITHWLLKEYFQLEEFELGIHFVEAAEMTQLNERFLRHAGSTDVITFDYSGLERGPCVSTSPLSFSATCRAGSSIVLAGEIFICVTEAQIQAQRYRTALASELVRYLIHGLLHLRGYDDRTPALRKKMKREEDRLLEEVTRRFCLKSLLKSGAPPRHRLKS